MIQEIASKYPMTEWPLPPPLPRVEIHPHVYVCPYVGLPLKMSTDRYDLKRIWFHYDIKSWHIDEFRRVALYNLMKRNLDNWQEWLRFDSTPKFYKIISRLRKEKDGAVIGIAGPKRSGKSIFGQMVLTRVVDSTPHVLFRYKDFEKHVENISDLGIGVQVDEDLKATGSESRNLVVHVNNAFETSRKAELWAVCTGVNLSFEGWGETLDLRLIPWGFNTKFQATRAAVFDKERDFLGLIVLQRKHRPDGHVFYAEEAGLWGEYKARAIEYSRSVIREGGATDAVDDVMQDRHIQALKDYFRIHFLEEGKEIPDDRRCRRWYRKAKLPAKSVAYMEEVILHAKDDLEDTDEIEEGTEDSSVVITSEGWEGLRDAFMKWGEKAYALYCVPLTRRMTWDDVAAHLGDSVTGDTLARGVKRRLSGRSDFPPTTKQLGDIGEAFCASLLDTLCPRVDGLPGRPDILCHPPGAAEIAVSVKLSLKENYRESEHLPESAWAPRAAAILIMPRLLELRVYQITAERMTINSNQGRLATTENLAEKVQEMIAHE